MNTITDNVANDAVEQYDIAKKQDEPMMTCVQAGMVSNIVSIKKAIEIILVMGFFTFNY